VFQVPKPTPRNNVNNVINAKYAINEKNVPPAPSVTLYKASARSRLFRFLR